MGGRQFFRISFLKLVIIGVFISLIGCGGGGGESILQSDQPKQESNQLVNILIEPDETLFWFEEDNSTLDSTLVTMGTEESIVELIDKINKQVVNSFQINFHREVLNLRNERNYVLNFSLKLEDEDECNREFYLKIYRTIRESGFLEVINKPLEIRNSSINIWDPQHKICNVTIEISPQEFMEFLENNIDANNFEVIFAKIKMNRRFLSDPVIGYTFIFVIDTHDVNTYFNLISNVSKSFYWYLNTSILMDYIANKIEDTKKWAGYVLLRMIKPLYTLSGAGVVIGLTEQVIETMNNPYSDSYVVIKKVTPNVLKNTIETFNKFGGKVLNTIDGMVYMVDKIKKEDLKAEDILIGGLVIAGLFVKESYKPVISTLVEVLKLEREKEGLAKKFVESAFAIATCESVPERLKYLNTLTQKIFTDIYSNIPQSDMCYLYKNRELPPVFTDKGYLYKEKNENFIIRHAFIKGTRSKIFALLFGIPYENENDDNDCWHCVSYAHIFTRDLFGSCTAVNETDKENLKSNLESFALDFFGSIFGLAEALVNPKEPESGNLVVTPDQYTVNEITSDQFSINPIKSGTSPCINHKAVCIEFVSNLENKVKQIFFKERKLIKQKCNDISHPTINNPPEIKVFSANQTFGEAPLTVEFEWEVVDPDGDTLTCHLDANNDKIYEYTGSCDTTTPISYTYNSAGTYTAVLKVNDGQYESLKSLTINVEQPVEQPSSRGLVAYWSFDECNWQNIRDLTGNGYDGHAIGNPICQEYAINNAAWLEGGTWIDIPYPPDLGNEFTITMWVYIPGDINILPDSFTVIGYEGAFCFSYIKHANYYAPSFWVHGASGSIFELDTGAMGILPGSLNFVAWIFSKGNIKIYLNGEEVFSRKYPDIGDIMYGNYIGLGHCPEDFTNTFFGFIDEVRIFKGVLSETEILEIFDSDLSKANLNNF